MLLIAKGTLIAGRYELVRPLAHGAMGAVWVALHRQLDSPVAIKFMVPTIAASREARARFEREAKAAALIRSVHIVPVVDYGVEDDTPFLVMELLDGEDLKTRIERAGHLPLGEVVEVVAQVARALRRAHEAGIIHRDLKPANVFISKNDDADLYRVVDFGVAKTVGLGAIGGTTQTGQVIGSPAYMSPEQARSEKAIDARSDLWSLAVIAYRCLTGRLPFTGGGTAMMLLAIVQDRALPPSRLAPHLPAALDPFFERALAKDPDERFPSAPDLAAAFAEAAGLRPRGAASSFAPAAPDVPSSLRKLKRTLRMEPSRDAATSTEVTTSPAGTKPTTLPMSAEAHADPPSPFARDHLVDDEPTPAIGDTLPTVPKQRPGATEPAADDTRSLSDSLPTVPRQPASTPDDPDDEAPPASESPPTLRKHRPPPDAADDETPPAGVLVAAEPEEPEDEPTPVRDSLSRSSDSLPAAPERATTTSMVVAEREEPPPPPLAKKTPSRGRLLGLLVAAAIAVGVTALVTRRGPGHAEPTALPAASGTTDDAHVDTAPTASASASTSAATPAPGRPQASEDAPRPAPPIPVLLPKPARAPAAAPPQTTASAAPQATNPHRLFGADN